ncbi:MAG TPA: hypothetical protein VK487_02785 [Candidatus Bathyarchaeia archaeon]|nr:hypothetical protein [Candidatus Bathyarchaeia archaeon]
MSKWSSIVFTISLFLLAYCLSHASISNVRAQSQETYVSKPALPVMINNSQISIGSNWTLTYDLQANLTYHVYFYGAWINNGSQPKTDYNVYVYNPLGELESIHTPSAGLPPHLGDNVSYAFFTPKYSGNYSFVIQNDPAESQAAQAGTFMVIQHVDTNEWYQQFIQGCVNALPVENTSWAFEFMTASKHIEVEIEVPNTLDMYEARLYLMANPSDGMGTILNNVSLAWEPGLYGNISGAFGGYNLNAKGYRGSWYASCEYPGQSMLINYTSPYSGESLYHLVLIGQQGAGNVNFVVKTDFQSPSINMTSLPQEVPPGQQVSMNFTVNGEAKLGQISMQYSNNGWNTTQIVPLALGPPNAYTVVIPGQVAGTRIEYNVTAIDVVGNKGQYSNSYAVKDPTVTNCTLKTRVWTLGRNTTVSGYVKPAAENLTVEVTFTPQNGSMVEIYVQTLTNGTFFASFSPNATGKWTVQATCLEDNLHFSSVSESVEFSVVKGNGLLSDDMIYICSAVGMVSIVAIAVVVIRRRNE